MSSKNKGLTKLINKLGLTKLALFPTSDWAAKGAPGSGYSVGTLGWKEEQKLKESRLEKIPSDPLKVVANGYRMVVDKKNGFIYFIRTKPDINAETYKMEDRLMLDYLSKNEEYNKLDLSNPQDKQKALAIRKLIYALVKEDIKTPEIQLAIRTNAEAAVGKPLTYQDVNADKSDRGLVFNEEALNPIILEYNSSNKPLHKMYKGLGDNDIPVMVSDESLNGMLSQTSSEAKLTPEMISLQLLNNGRARQIALDMQNLDPYIDNDIYWGLDEDITKLNTFRKAEAKDHFKALPKLYLDALLTSETLPAEQKAVILQQIGYDAKDTSKALLTIENHLRAKAELAYQLSRAFEYAFRNADGKYNLVGNSEGSKGLFNETSTGDQLVALGIRDIMNGDFMEPPKPPKSTANIALAMAHSQVAPGAMHLYRTNFNRDNLMQADFADELRNSTFGKTVDSINEGGQWVLNRVADTGYNGYKYVTDWDNHTWKSDVYGDAIKSFGDIGKPTNLGIMVGDVLTGGTVALMLLGAEALDVRDRTLPSLIGNPDLPLTRTNNLRKLTPLTAQDLMVLKNIYAPGRLWNDDGEIDTTFGIIGTALLPFGAYTKPATAAANVAAKGVATTAATAAAKEVATNAAKEVATTAAANSLLNAAAKGSAKHVVSKGKDIAQYWKRGFNFKDWSLPTPIVRAPFVLTDPLNLLPKSIAGLSLQMLAALRTAMPNLAGGFHDTKYNMKGNSFKLPFSDWHDITGDRNKALSLQNARHLAEVKAKQEAERAAANYTLYRPIDSSKPTTTIKPTAKPSAKSTALDTNNLSEYAPWALAGVGALGLGALALSATNRNRLRLEEEEEYRRRYLYSMSPRYRKKYMY